MAKKHRCIWIDDAVWDLAKKQGINISQTITGFLETMLDISDEKEALLKLAEQQKIDIAATMSKLKQLKTRTITNLKQLFNYIEENDWEDYEKEDIKYHIIGILSIIRKDRNKGPANCFMLKRKYSISIKPEQLIAIATSDDFRDFVQKPEEFKTPIKPDKSTDPLEIAREMRAEFEAKQKAKAMKK